MSSPQEIRQGAVALLEAAGITVFDSDPTPWTESEQPGVRVFSASGQSSNLSLAQPLWRWDDTLTLDCITIGTDPAAVAQARDTLEDAVLATLLKDQDWVNLWERIDSVSADYGHGADGSHYSAQAIIRITGHYPRQWTMPEEDALSSIFVTADKIEDATGEPDGVVDLEVQLP